MSIPSSFLRPLAPLFLAILAVPLLAQPTYPIDGYVSRVLSPTIFEVNGRQFVVTPQTAFGLMGSDYTSTTSPLRQALRIGVYVQVAGRESSPFSPIRATAVMVHDDWDSKLSGTGVITRIVTPGDDPVYEADGYLVRIGPSTQVDFLTNGAIQEVGVNTWVHFSGKRGKDGVLEASKAQFIPAKPTKFKAVKDIEIATVETRPAGVKDKAATSKATGAPASSADGEDLQQDEELKIGLGRWHTFPADQPLQQRVHRIGMALVPAYQRDMADDNPSKIHFRFFAIDNKKWRGAVCLLDGAILIPSQTIERLKNDDQLAAVLADGVACNLQRQNARAIAAMRRELGIDIAFDVAGAFVPGLGIAAIAVNGGFRGNDPVTMLEERLRIALALMSDAGYDPWQAPEAWRLVLPGKLPANPVTLPYPDVSCYQLGILNVQYQRK